MHHTHHKGITNLHLWMFVIAKLHTDPTFPPLSPRITCYSAATRTGMVDRMDQSRVLYAWACGRPRPHAARERWKEVVYAPLSIPITVARSLARSKGGAATGRAPGEGA